MSLEWCLEVLELGRNGNIDFFSKLGIGYEFCDFDWSGGGERVFGCFVIFNIVCILEVSVIRFFFIIYFLLVNCFI